MRIVFAGGGTAGHINPAIAIAQFIKSRHTDADIHFVGNKDSLEERIVKQKGFTFHTIDVKGLKRSFSPENIKIMGKAIKATGDCKKLLKQIKPDIAVGTGGYVSFPLIKAASDMGIPTAIHEQNAFPGITSRILSKKVDCVMISFADSKGRLPKNAKTVLVGNPIREEFVFADKQRAREILGIPKDKKLIVSFAGSLGAREFNNAVIEMMNIEKDNESLLHIHATGRYGFKWMPDKLADRGITPEKYPNIRVREYIDDMWNVMAAADVVIGRGGAGTIAELLALAKPAILVPSPNVTHNHQYHNVMSLVRENAAMILEEKDISGKNLVEMTRKIFADKNFEKTLSDNAVKLAIYDSSQKIYEQLMDIKKIK